jgi:hypothetical protein
MDCYIPGNICNQHNCFGGPTGVCPGDMFITNQYDCENSGYQWAPNCYNGYDQGQDVMWWNKWDNGCNFCMGYNISNAVLPAYSCNAAECTDHTYNFGYNGTFQPGYESNTLQALQLCEDWPQGLEDATDEMTAFEAIYPNWYLSNNLPDCYPIAAPPCGICGSGTVPSAAGHCV